MNYKATLGLSLVTLLAIGAGCASSTTTTDTNDADSDITNVNAPAEDSDTSLLVPVDPNSGVEETVVVEDEDEAEEALAPATQTFNIVAQQFEFSPSTITVNQGDTVVLNLTTADVPHGFSLSQFGVSETITPGKTKTVEFVADTAGTFTFACTVVCGSGHTGMSGSLIVN